MVIRVVEFSGGGDKFRKIFAGAETIQGRKLFKGGNYTRKYGRHFLTLPPRLPRYVLHRTWETM